MPSLQPPARRASRQSARDDRGPPGRVRYESMNYGHESDLPVGPTIPEPSGAGGYRRSTIGPSDRGAPEGRGSGARAQPFSRGREHGRPDPSLPQRARVVPPAHRRAGGRAGPGHRDRPPGRDRALLHHAHPGPQGAARAADRGGRGGPPHLHPVEPAPRRVDRQALPGHRHDPPRPHPGGQPRADAGGREVRPPQGLQVLHLRHLVDPAVDRPRHRRQGPHDPAPLPPRRHDGGAVEGLGHAAQDARARAHRRRAGRGDGHDRGAGARRAARRPRPRVAVGVDR